MQTTIPVVKSLSRRPKGNILRKQITTAAKNAIEGHKHFSFDGRQTVFKDEPTANGVDVVAEIILNKSGATTPEEEQTVLTKLTEYLSKTKWEMKVGDTKRITSKPKAANGTNGHVNHDDEADVRPRQLRDERRSPAVDETPEKTEKTVPLNFDPSGFFDHLIDREPHVNIVTSAIAAMIASGLKSRFHVLVTGPEGAGKTDFLRAVANMVGEGNYKFIDGPADAPRQLNTAVPIVLVDDLDRFSDDRFNWLPNAMAQSLVIASASSLDKLSTRLSGAVMKQFVMRAPMPAPDVDLLTRILQRDIKTVQGDTKWIEPAINYCILRDGKLLPQRVRAVCLTGRNGLLDSTFQKSLDALWEIEHPKTNTSTGV